MQEGTVGDDAAGCCADEDSERLVRENMISRMLPQNPVFRRIAEEVVYMRIKTIGPVIIDALKYNDPRKVVYEGLAAGMSAMAKLYAEQLCTLPELMMAAKTMEAGISMAEERMGVVRRPGTPENANESDPHDIGRGVGSVLLKAHGFGYEDMGENIPVSVEAVTQYVSMRPQMVSGTALMTSSLKPFPQSSSRQ